MECALFRKDYDARTPTTTPAPAATAASMTLWNVPCLERITTIPALLFPQASVKCFMECALFRKDYDSMSTHRTN